NVVVVEPRGRRPIARPGRRSLVVVAVAVAVAVTVSAQESTPPCATCVVLAIAAGDLHMAGAGNVPVAVVIPASSSDEGVAASLSLVPQLRAVAVILDA